MTKAILSLFVILSSSVSFAAPSCLLETKNALRAEELVLEVKENTDLAAYVLRTQEEGFNVSVVLVDGRYIANIVKGDSSASTVIEGDLELSLKKGSERLSVSCPAN
ncbi:hypothetical protein [Bdellovibrio bacteriovorus]|uniref:Uncharacterized protein n=1 Tax=Bdellovibrio bacteriovorus str. Tiberius TaxID=1069642 RepID=K7YVP1_BDEBC|nr:hypothetical protein [Bdellovibrio bacteriovorus]AFY00760.1 hypothetical protein Bdt_1060 [Bdellovibrio bacteriovorus str. Tiberius]